MAKKKNKAKYRAASKNAHSEASSNTSDASSTNHQLDDDSNDSNQVGEASKPNKKHELEISETQFLQRIFDSYFDGYCSLKSEKRGEVCIQCQRSADPKRADKPCWYGTSESTGKLLKKFVLDGCLKETKDQEIGDKRSFFMSTFTELLVNSIFYKETPLKDPSTGMPASDIQHLKSIEPQDMYDLYTQSPHAPFRDAFLELLNIVHLVAWKIKHVERYSDEDVSVMKFLEKTRKEVREKEEYLKIIESKSLLDDMKELSKAEKKDDKEQIDSVEEGLKGKVSCINLLRNYIVEVAFGPFEKVSFHMLIFLLSTFNGHITEILNPERLAKFFEYYDSYFINFYASQNNLIRPNSVWLDCLTHNIRTTFKLLWVCARTAAKTPQMPNFCKEKFLYPIQVTESVRRGYEYLDRDKQMFWRRLIFETYTFENPDNEAGLDDENYKHYCDKVKPIILHLITHGFTEGDLLGNIRWYTWHKGFYKLKNLTMNEVSALNHIVMPCITQHVLPLDKGRDGKGLSCCVCEAKVKGTVYNEKTKELEFAEATFWEKSLIAHCTEYSPQYIPVMRNPFIPCEVSVLEREDKNKHWSKDEEPPLDVRNWGRSFGIVCSSRCLIENERMKLGKLNRFINYGKADLIYDDKYAKMDMGPAHTESEAKRESSLAKTFIGILEEINKGTIAEAGTPLQFLKAYDKCQNESRPGRKNDGFENSLKEFIARFLYISPHGVKYILMADLAKRYPLNADVLFNVLCHPNTNSAIPKLEGIKLLKGEKMFEKERLENSVVIPPEPCRMSTRSDPATLIYATIEEFKEDIFFIDEEEKVMGPCQTKEQIAERRCTHREMVTTTLVWCGRWAEMFYKGATESVPLYDVHADMTAESCSKWNAIRRFEMDFPSHFTDNIESSESSGSIQLKGMVSLNKSQLDDMFIMPSCCVFPINNQQIELHYLHYGTKFIITDEQQKKRIRKQLMRNWDALLFVQRLDLMAQTAVGGFIFTDVLGENKMAAIIVSPSKLFNYIMNNQSLSSFLIDFMGYLHSGFDSKFIHRYETNLRAEQDMARWLYLDNLARFRGREQYRFGSLPMEVLRARFQPHKMPTLIFQKEWFMKEGKKQMQLALNNIYKLILKLDVPEWPTNTGKTLDLCWPIEYFGTHKSTVADIIALWKSKWPHYTQGANEARFYWENAKTVVNQGTMISECPVQKEVIKMACSEGVDIGTRLVFLDHIRIRYPPKFDPYKDYPLSHYFMATFQLRGNRDFNWRRLTLHFAIRPHSSETRKCLVPGDALFLDIIQMHSPVDIPDLSKVTLLYRKWAMKHPYLVPLPTNATPRAHIDIFGLTEDMPTEYHVILFDYKKYKTICKAHIVKKSLYWFHPPYNELHVQNYPHNVLVRRQWCRENDKHIASGGHNLMWHGKVMVPVPSQIMFFQEKFKNDNGKRNQYLAKGFDTSRMYREIDTFVFQCEKYEKENKCRKEEPSYFFSKHRTVLFYPLVDAEKGKNTALLTEANLPKANCKCCDTEKAFHQYCLTMGSSIDLETVRQDLVGDIFAKHMNEFTIGLFYGRKDLNSFDNGNELKKRANTPQNVNIFTDTEIGPMDFVFVKYDKKLKRFTILDPKHPDHFPYSSSTTLAFSSIYLEYPYLKRLQCKIKDPRDAFYGVVNTREPKIYTTDGDVTHIMTYRHEISDEQGVCLFWQKCYLSALEKRTTSLRHLQTSGDQFFIWPNIEAEKGSKASLFKEFYDQYAITDTARMDNYYGIWKNLTGERDIDILLFTNYSFYDAYADHEADHEKHYFLLARPYNSSDTTVGWFDCSFIYEFWKQRKIVEMLKTNLTKYMEKRTTSIQRYMDRKLCHEKGDMAKYNKLCIYRDEKSLLLNHGINMFKEFLDKDLIDPVEREELQNQIEDLNKAGLLYTSPLYKMKKEKVEINYSRLWEQIVIAQLSKKLDGITWKKTAEVQEKEVLRKKVAQAEIDMHPDNPWKNDTDGKGNSNEKKGWGFVTQDKNEHFKSTLPKDEAKRKRRSSMGMSTLTSLISALTSSPVTVESISANEENNVIVVQTSSDGPIMPNRVIGACIARRDSDSSSDSSSPEPPKKPPPPPPQSELSKKGESEVMKKLIAQNEEETAKQKIMDKMKGKTEESNTLKKNGPPKEPPKPLFRKGFLNGPEKKSPAPVKRDVSQPKIPSSPKKADSSAQKPSKENVSSSPKKADSSAQKPSKENVCSEQKQKIVIDFAKNMKIIRAKEAGLEKNLFYKPEDMKLRMKTMRCYGCNKLASELFPNSFPESLMGIPYRRMVYPRHCFLCFSENNQFFCSKKCFSSGEKNHAKKCKLAQVQKNKTFFESLNL